MPSPGRSSASSRSSATASPKWRKRPPLQVPIAARPGSFTAGLRLRLVAGAVGAVSLGLAAAVLLRSDADLLALRLRFALRLLRGDDLQAERFVLLVAGGVAADHHRRAWSHLAPAQDFVGERVLDVALDRPAQRAGAHRRVPALVDQQVLGLV